VLQVQKFVFKNLKHLYEERFEICGQYISIQRHIKYPEYFIKAPIRQFDAFINNLTKSIQKLHTSVILP